MEKQVMDTCLATEYIGVSNSYMRAMQAQWSPKRKLTPPPREIRAGFRAGSEGRGCFR